MDIPLVSISCITYNHVKYISDCLEGFLMQKTNFSFEVLINDDASTDGTSAILQEYANKYDCIKLLIQEENQWSQGQRGMNIKFNFPRAKGKYIALCEGDDCWTDPYKLQKQVEFLEDNPEYVACFTNAMVLNEADGSENSFLKNALNERLDFTTILEKSGGVYPTASLMIRNNTLEFPNFIQKADAGDWALILLLASKGDLGYLDHITCLYRKHSGGAFTSIETNMELRRRMNINSIKFLHELNEYLGYTKTREIKRKISQLAKKVILRTSGNKYSKANIDYFKELNFLDTLSLLKHMFFKSLAK